MEQVARATKQKATWDTKELFMRGMLAFGRVFGGFKNPMESDGEQKNYSPSDARKRRNSHAKFKAQCAARREQRKRS